MTNMEKIEDYTLEDTKPSIKVSESISDDIEEIIESKQGFFRWIFSIFTSDKKIGELNGRWALLFKLAMFLIIVSIPTLFSWAIWVTSNIYTFQSYITATEGYSERIIELEKTDASRASVLIKLEELDKKIDTLPPPDWRRRIELLEKEYGEISQRIIDVDKENTSDHSKILTSLDLILTEIKNK